MKIVDRETFLKMPPGTVFSKYIPCAFDEMGIKGDSMFWENGNDFFYQEITNSVDYHNSNDLIDKLEQCRLTGASVSFDFDVQSRDGCFDYDQLFAVWEPQDVRQLINRLERCLP